MTTLIERLRDAAALPTGLYAEAADEIERLHDLLREAHLAHGFMPIPTRALHGLRDRIRASRFGWWFNPFQPYIAGSPCEPVFFAG